MQSILTSAVQFFASNRPRIRLEVDIFPCKTTRGGLDVSPQKEARILVTDLCTTNQEDSMADLDAVNGDSNFPIVRDGVAAYLHDNDPEETREWMDSLDGLLDSSDPVSYTHLTLPTKA